MPNKGNHTPHWLKYILLFSLVLIFILLRPLQLKPIVVVEDLGLRLFSGTIQRFSSWTNHTRKTFSALFNSKKLITENEQLSLQLRLSKVQLALVEHIVYENERLMQLMKLDSLQHYSVQYAEIINRHGDNPNNFTLSAGANHNIKLNQAVVLPIEVGPQKRLYHQLVGRINEVLPHHSRVLSIMDERSQISIRNMRNQSLGTLFYVENDIFLSIRVRQENQDFQVGDLVVSSELSTLPKGLIIGMVAEIEESNSLYKKVSIAIPLPLLSFAQVGILSK